MATSTIIADSSQIKESYLRYYALRLNHGFTDADVAERLKIAGSTLYYWKKGEKMPSVRNLFRIAQLLDTQASYIANGITI